MDIEEHEIEESETEADASPPLKRIVKWRCDGCKNEGEIEVEGDFSDQQIYFAVEEVHKIESLWGCNTLPEIEAT